MQIMTSMKRTIRGVARLLLISQMLLGLSVTAAENPLGKFFMMMGRGKDGNAKPQQNHANNKNLNIESISCTMEELQTSKQETSQALQERDNAVQEAAKIREEMNRLSQMYAKQLDQLTAQQESAQRIAEAQEEYTSIMAANKRRTDQELKDLKEAMAAKDNELLKVKEDYQEKLLQQKEQFNKKAAEMEVEWKKGVTNVENASKKQLQVLEERLKVEKEQAIKEARSEIKASLDDALTQIKKLEAEKSTILGEKQAITTMFHNAEKKYEDFLKDQEGTIDAFVEERMFAEVAAKVKEVTDKWQKDYNKLKDESAKKLEEEKEAASKVLEETREELQAESDILLADLQAEHTKSISELESLHASALDKVKTKLSETADKVSSLERDKTALIEKLKSTEEMYKEKLHAKESEYKTKLQNMKDSYDKELGKVMSALSTMIKHAKYWESAFVGRSSINLTHISEDVVRVADRVRSVTVDHVNKAKSQVVEKLDPYTSKSRYLYIKHIKNHVDTASKHARPHCDKLIVPLLQKAGDALVAGRKEFKKGLNKMFDGIVQNFKANCPKTVASLREISAPLAVIDQVRASCKRPEESVKTFLKVVGLITMILLRRTLYGLVFGTLLLVLRIIWFFSPIRILFFKTKKPAKIVASKPKAKSKLA